MNPILRIICLIFPLGIAIFIIKRDSQPKIAKEALRMALMGFGITMVLGIILSSI